MSAASQPAPVAGQVWHLQDAMAKRAFATLIGTYGGSGAAAPPGTPALRDLSLHYWYLKPGELDDQAPHKEDEAYLVLAGGGALEIWVGESGERVPLAPLDLVFVPRGVHHRFTDVGAEGLHLLIVFAPDFSG
jgi:mannose-6-phosphate isomerase-like protein (cupin superfamily)